MTKLTIEERLDRIEKVCKIMSEEEVSKYQAKRENYLTGQLEVRDEMGVWVEVNNPYRHNFDHLHYEEPWTGTIKVKIE